MLPNDKVAFGLEKVPDDYDTIDVEEKVLPTSVSTVKNLRPEIPRTTKHTKNSETYTIFNKRQKTHYTKKLSSEENKIINKPIKVPLRGLRRSIDQNNEQRVYINAPQSLVMKVRHVEGKSRVELKVLTERKRSDERKQSLNNANFELDNENSTIINLDGNDTLVINVLNGFKCKNDSILNENKDSKLSETTNDLVNVYTIDLLDKNMIERYSITKEINKTSQITTSQNLRTQFKTHKS